MNLIKIRISSKEIVDNKILQTMRNMNQSRVMMTLRKAITEEGLIQSM